MLADDYWVFVWLQEDLSEESDGDLFSSSGTVPKATVSQSSENKDNVDPVKNSKENVNICFLLKSLIYVCDNNILWESPGLDAIFGYLIKKNIKILDVNSHLVKQAAGLYLRISCKTGGKNKQTQRYRWWTFR